MLLGIKNLCSSAALSIKRIAYLLVEQTVHYKHQHALQAVEKDKDVRHGHGGLKLEAAKDPHGAQDSKLSHCSDCECPAGGDKYIYDIPTLTQWMSVYFTTTRALLHI